LARGLDTPRGRDGIVAAFKDLTDGLSVLVRQHLELVRLEVKEDAQILGGHIAIFALFGAIVLMGYGLLNLSAILFAGWGFGLHGMAVTSLVLAIVNLGIGARALRGAFQRIKADGVALDRTAQELEKDIEWVRQIREK
jgi:hypothetical protein